MADETGTYQTGTIKPTEQTPPAAPQPAAQPTPQRATGFTPITTQEEFYVRIKNQIGNARQGAVRRYGNHCRVPSHA